MLKTNQNQVGIQTVNTHIAALGFWKSSQHCKQFVLAFTFLQRRTHHGIRESCPQSVLEVAHIRSSRRNLVTVKTLIVFRLDPHSPIPLLDNLGVWNHAVHRNQEVFWSAHGFQHVGKRIHDRPYRIVLLQITMNQTIEVYAENIYIQTLLDDARNASMGLD